MLLLFDPARARYGDNPLYRREISRRGGGRLVLQILAGLALTCDALACGVCIGVSLHWLDPDSHVFTFFLTLPHYFLVGWGTPAWAATAIAAERDDDTLAMLLISPFPRRQILPGILAGRLSPLLRLTAWSLPLFLLGGAVAFLPDRADHSGTLRLMPTAMGAAFGLVIWVGYLGAFAFSVSASASGSVGSAHSGAAIGSAYKLLFLWVLLGSMVCSVLILFTHLFVWRYYWSEAMKKMEAMELE